jgi:hypothetical protein
MSDMERSYVHLPEYFQFLPAKKLVVSPMDSLAGRIYDPRHAEGALLDGRRPCRAH